MHALFTTTPRLYGKTAEKWSGPGLDREQYGGEIFESLLFEAFYH